jgi:hypothetical protein
VIGRVSGHNSVAKLFQDARSPALPPVNQQQDGGFASIVPGFHALAIDNFSPSSSTRHENVGVICIGEGPFSIARKLLMIGWGRQELKISAILPLVSDQARPALVLYWKDRR